MTGIATGDAGSTAEPRQLSLAIRLNDEARFVSFFCVEESHHQRIVDLLISGVLADQREPFIYLWGNSGSGVSHLLQAACHHGQQSGLQVQYLPLPDLLDFPPQQLFENMEQLDLICLDSIQAIAGDRDWQQAIFDLYNRVRERGGRLVVGADCPPRELPLALADLQSRLSWGPAFQLPSLSDDEKAAVIQFRAARRGMIFADDPARFLIRRSGRSMSELIEKLDVLEQLAVYQNRKLTIPFLKQVFDW